MRCGLQRANSIRRRVYKKQAQKKARIKAGYSILAVSKIGICERIGLRKMPKRINQSFIADKLSEQPPVMRIQVTECRV
tara:strand:- start:325 stop:561 length:237 start_codon:yes stop_codon:yes gene_type:complete